MRITHLTATPYRVPRRSVMTSALGEQHWSEYGLVRLGLEDGTEGIGEISLIWHGDGARLCTLVDDLVAPVVVGADVFEYTRIVGAVRRAFEFGRHSQTAVAAVEMAVLDAQGKLLGRPVVDLLGGRSLDRVRLSMSLSIAAARECVREAAGYVDAGFTAVKVKAHRDADHLVATVAALRKEFGDDLGIRVDLNMACVTAKEAVRTIRRLEGYDVLSVEQPLHPDDHDGLALVRERTDAPVMVDESVWTPEDARAVLARGAADFINVYVAESGGIRPARLIAEMAALHHVGIAIGSMPETGAGTSAAAHLAFSLPRLEHPSDVAGWLYHADDVVSTDLEIADGHLLPPTRPGLGIDVDEERLERHAI
ncbi:mandelate racemase/muconate lactonizing enzyme family protein [Jiangella rhizosphaerae]|uniref:Mandelate racemase/muconate lactonizing enzyme C-terminal domain-containing protein n=1 Tax=Jiangella rhizosphaerae TaxID=2293569 RepID=A0A418KM29_9ACTN|nr:mandelate racemase/muconate lactonizing enzyme family protein [Jiangella rhizosphaerae]RIQ19004.1 hypothetical protein DY240_20270 [Jiangella rhizosphaerae]